MKTDSIFGVEDIRKCFSDAVDLGDGRFPARLQRIVSKLAQNSDESFPGVFESKADLAGFYRFVSNERVDPSLLSQAVCSATADRLPQDEDVLAIHDTTSFEFTERADIEGLGRLSQSKLGFFGHFCLAARFNRELMGVLGLHPWVRTEKRWKARKRLKDYQDPKRESLKWEKLIREVHSRVKDPSRLIHVADREADHYRSYSYFVEHNIRFVFRANYDRKTLDPEFPKLFDSLRETQVSFEREVKLSIRKPTSLPRDSRDHAPRAARIAHLGVAAKRVEIKKTLYAPKKNPKSLFLNFVRVFEVDCPKNERPVEWMLATSEPIETPEDLARIVDIYRARWTIEEYFKALKTGCSFEKRGLESAQALFRCLAIFAPIACLLYNLKMWAVSDPNRNSSDFATPIQIQILAKKTKKKPEEIKTARDLLLAIAAMGGHLKYNGTPGWQVLSRGYEKLLQLEQGYWVAVELFQSSKGLNPD